MRRRQHGNLLHEQLYLKSSLLTTDAQRGLCVPQGLKFMCDLTLVKNRSHVPVERSPVYRATVLVIGRAAAINPRFDHIVLLIRSLRGWQVRCWVVGRGAATILFPLSTT